MAPRNGQGKGPCAAPAGLRGEKRENGRRPEQWGCGRAPQPARPTASPGENEVVLTPPTQRGVPGHGEGNPNTNRTRWTKESVTCGEAAATRQEKRPRRKRKKRNQPCAAEEKTAEEREKWQRSPEGVAPLREGEEGRERRSRIQPTVEERESGGRAPPPREGRLNGPCPSEFPKDENVTGESPVNVGTRQFWG